MLLDIIPVNIIDVMAKNDLLAVIFRDPIRCCRSRHRQSLRTCHEFLRIHGKYYVQADADGDGHRSDRRSRPDASVGQFGIALLLPMLKLIGTVFLGLFLILFVLFPIVGLIFKIKYFEVLKMIWDLF